MRAPTDMPEVVNDFDIEEEEIAIENRFYTHRYSQTCLESTGTFTLQRLSCNILAVSMAPLLGEHLTDTDSLVRFVRCPLKTFLTVHVVQFG